MYRLLVLKIRDRKINISKGNSTPTLMKPGRGGMGDDFNPGFSTVGIFRKAEKACKSFKSLSFARFIRSVKIWVPSKWTKTSHWKYR